MAHLQVTVDTAVGPVIVEITMPPDYPQRQLPDLSLRCDSHRLVISDALKALKKEVSNSSSREDAQVNDTTLHYTAPLRSHFRLKDYSEWP